MRSVEDGTRDTDYSLGFPGGDGLPGRPGLTGPVGLVQDTSGIAVRVSIHE
jgi:hypothetical protein